jgi:hypothetical protein
MAGQPQKKNGYTEFSFSIIRLLFTIAVESFQDLGRTTYISTRKKNGNGERVIRVEVGE